MTNLNQTPAGAVEAVQSFESLVLSGKVFYIEPSSTDSTDIGLRQITIKKPFIKSIERFGILTPVSFVSCASLPSGTKLYHFLNGQELVDGQVIIDKEYKREVSFDASEGFVAIITGRNRVFNWLGGNKKQKLHSVENFVKVTSDEDLSNLINEYNRQSESSSFEILNKFAVYYNTYKSKVASKILKKMPSNVTILAKTGHNVTDQASANLASFLGRLMPVYNEVKNGVTVVHTNVRNLLFNEILATTTLAKLLSGTEILPTDKKLFDASKPLEVVEYLSNVAKYAGLITTDNKLTMAKTASGNLVTLSKKNFLDYFESKKEVSMKIIEKSQEATTTKIPLKFNDDTTEQTKQNEKLVRAYLLAKIAKSEMTAIEAEKLYDAKKQRLIKGKAFDDVLKLATAARDKAIKVNKVNLFKQLNNYDLIGEIAKTMGGKITPEFIRFLNEKIGTNDGTTAWAVADGTLKIIPKKDVPKKVEVPTEVPTTEQVEVPTEVPTTEQVEVPTEVPTTEQPTTEEEEEEEEVEFWSNGGGLDDNFGGMF